jgi:hypothetical protein
MTVDSRKKQMSWLLGETWGLMGLYGLAGAITADFMITFVICGGLFFFT